ncbi:DUF4190 domain-containing protein [Saccharopolyspora pogona]|uniref:DUF4190 domain-containing protein n=1 Tax=Saccharopolyspora pogona TaxID=333966 RepID=UPI00168851A8|nr:DUF4190 domain-containing protein [Saccharopolyspora pogona]
MTYQQAPQPYAPPKKAKFGGLAVAALVLGIVGVVGSIIPILNNLTALTALVGLVLGVLAIFGTKKVMASISSALCVLAIVLTVVFQGIMVRELDKALGNGNGSSETTEPVRLNFGQTHKWKSGEAISVSPPASYAESNQFLQPAGGKRFVQFDVKVHNEGGREYNVMSSTITAQHNGRVAQQNYMAGDTLPNAQVPPGGDVTYTIVYEIGTEPGEIQVSVQSNPFASETVYFVGQV